MLIEPNYAIARRKAQDESAQKVSMKLDIRIKIPLVRYFIALTFRPRTRAINK